jgi:hypothetical protein
MSDVYKAGGTPNDPADPFQNVDPEVVEHLKRVYPKGTIVFSAVERSPRSGQEIAWAFTPTAGATYYAVAWSYARSDRGRSEHTVEGRLLDLNNLSLHLDLGMLRLRNGDGVGKPISVKSVERNFTAGQQLRVFVNMRTHEVEPAQMGFLVCKM